MHVMVSVVLPAYNSASYIEATIQSIRDQTYRDWELLIVDDCSSDNIEYVVERLRMKDSRIRFFRLEINSGAGIARNKGIREASGRYIAFLDSDDRWDQRKLAMQIDFMEKKKCSFSFTDYYIVNHEGDMQVFHSLKDKVEMKDMIRFNYIACSTVIYNTERLGKIYMKDYRNRQDWGLWLDILKKTDVAFCLKEPLSYYYQRKESISSNKLKLIPYHWKIYRDHLGGSFIWSLLQLTRNMILHVRFAYEKDPGRNRK